MPDILLDLPRRGPLVTGPRRVRYPFAHLGDYDTVLFARDYTQRLADFKPVKRGLPDHRFPKCRALGETDPAPTGISDLIHFTRTFGVVPPQQILGATYLFNSPNLPPVSLGDLTARYSSFNVPNGAAQVVGAYSYLSITELATHSGYYSAAGSWSLSGGTYTVTGLTFIVGDIVILRTSSSSFSTATVATVTGGNQITLGSKTDYTHNPGFTNPQVAEWAFGALLSADSTLRKRTRSSCHQGAVLTLPARRVTDFYLPGYTGGITTFADIPPQNGFTLEDFLAAYAAVTTWFNVQADVLALWENTSVYMQAYTQCRLTDV
jgi:hypothetical protein